MGKALREKKSFGLPRKILDGTESEENFVGCVRQGTSTFD